MESREEQASQAPEFDRKSQHAPELIENRPEAAPQVWRMPAMPEQQQQRFGPFGDSQASFAQGYAAHHGVHTPPPPPPKAEGDLFAHDSEDKPRRRPGRIAGLPIWGFWLLLGIAGVAVIGASVGGAIGGSSAAKDHNASSSVSTASSGSDTVGTSSAISSASSSASSAGTASAASGTLTTSAAISTTSTAATQSASLMISGSEIYTEATSDCPGSNGTTYTPTAAGGGPSIYTYTKYCGATMELGVNDITEAYLTTFDSCIDMCSSWNYYNVGGVQCRGVVFQYGESGAPPGNCWIKNSSGVPSFVSNRNSDVALPLTD